MQALNHLDSLDSAVRFRWSTESIRWPFLIYSDGVCRGPIQKDESTHQRISYKTLRSTQKDPEIDRLLSMKNTASPRQKKSTAWPSGRNPWFQFSMAYANGAIRTGCKKDPHVSVWPLRYRPCRRKKISGLPHFVRIHIPHKAGRYCSNGWTLGILARTAHRIGTTCQP